MCKQQLDRLIGMGIVITARLGQVGPLASDGETDDQIVESRHGMTEGGDHTASRIFVKRDIAAIVQAILNPQCPRFKLSNRVGGAFAAVRLVTP
jgi:hypothetical protein